MIGKFVLKKSEVFDVVSLNGAVKYTQISLQLVAKALHLWCNDPTCFGYIFWPSSGSNSLNDVYTVYDNFSYMSDSLYTYNII